MTEIAGKIREMDIACEKSVNAMPQFPEYGRGMSASEDWKNLQKEVYERKQEFWAEFHGGWDEDFDRAYLLKVLRFKLKRNKERFLGYNDWHQPHFPLGETQEVRFRKAYCLLWALMKDNLLCWWD